jgi:hypothetical protein
MYSEVNLIYALLDLRSGSSGQESQAPHKEVIMLPRQVVSRCNCWPICHRSHRRESHIGCYAISVPGRLILIFILFYEGKKSLGIGCI